MRFLSNILGSEPAALSRIAPVVAAGGLRDVEGAATARQSSVLAALANMHKSLSSRFKT